MEAEQVRTWLGEHANLPQPVIELLSEREYADEAALEGAVAQMGEALAAQFGGGRIRDNDAAKPAPPPEPSQVREAYAQGLDAVNRKWLGR